MLSNSELLRGHTVTLIYEGKGFALMSDGESTLCSAVPYLRFTQEETDSIVVLYRMYARPRIQGCESKKPGHRYSFYSMHYANHLQGI